MNLSNTNVLIVVAILLLPLTTPINSRGHEIKKRVIKYPVDKGPIYLNQHFGVNRIRKTIPAQFTPSGSVSLEFATPGQFENYSKPSDCNPRVYVETYGSMFHSETPHKAGILLSEYSHGSISVHRGLETYERPVARSRIDNTVPYLSKAGPLRYVIKACGQVVTKGQLHLDTAQPRPANWEESTFVNYHGVRAYPKQQMVSFSGTIETTVEPDDPTVGNPRQAKLRFSGQFPYLYQLASTSRLTVQQKYEKDISSDPGTIQCPTGGAFGGLACTNFYASQKLNKKIKERALDQLYSQCSGFLTMQLGPGISYNYGGDTINRLPIGKCFVNFKDMYRLHLPALELLENHLPASPLSQCERGGLCDMYWHSPSLLPETLNRSKQFDASIDRPHPVKWGGALKEGGAWFDIDPDRDRAYILPGKVGTSLPDQFNLTAKVHGHLGLTDHGRLPKNYTHQFPGSNSRFLRWNIPIGPDDVYYPANQPIPGSLRTVDAHGWLNENGSTFHNDGGAALANHLISNPETRIIAADGVARLLVRYVPESNGTHNISLTGDGSGSSGFHGSLSKLTGSGYKQELGFQVSDKNPIYFLYRAPKDFAFGRDAFKQEVNRRVSIKIEGPDNTTEQKHFVMRPPVVFVHGLRSSPSAWNELIDNLQFTISFGQALSKTDEAISKVSKRNIRWPYLKTNYKTTHESAFNINDNKVLSSIQRAIQHLQNNTPRVAVEQVDVIGHSMGGLLARRVAGDMVTIPWGHSDLTKLKEMRPNKRLINFLEMLPSDEPHGPTRPSFHWLVQSSFKPSNQNKGLVNKLVTINSPHLGSPLANVMIEMRRSIFSMRGEGNQITKRSCKTLLQALGLSGIAEFKIAGKAYDDLIPTSLATRTLPKVNKAKTSIIAGNYENLNSFGTSNSPVNTLVPCLNNFIDFEQDLLPGDGVVPLQSGKTLNIGNNAQRILLGPLGPANPVYHTGILLSKIVSSHINTLLNNKTDSKFFSNLRSNTKVPNKKFNNIMPDDLSRVIETTMKNPYLR